MSNPAKGPRLLTPEELADFQREMAASSAWMKAELKRRREATDTAHAQLASDAVRGVDDVSAGRFVDADALLAQIQAWRRAVE